MDAQGPDRRRPAGAALSRSYRNAGHATGDTPGGHRFRIGRCSPGLSSCSGAACRGTCCHGRWAVGPARRVGGGSSGGNERGCGSGSTPCCSPNFSGAAANSTWPAPLWTVHRSAPCAGEKNWTEPYRSPQGRVEASCSHRRARDSARRDPDGGEPARRHAAPAPGRRLSNPARLCRAVPRPSPQLVQGDRGYDSQPHRDQLQHRGIASQLAKRGRPHGSGLGRTRWVVERTLAWLHRFRRLAVRYQRRPCVHEAFLVPGLLARVLVLPQARALISQRALK